MLKNASLKDKDSPLIALSKKKPNKTSSSSQHQINQYLDLHDLPTIGDPESATIKYHGHLINSLRSRVISAISMRDSFFDELKSLKVQLDNLHENPVKKSLFSSKKHTEYQRNISLLSKKISSFESIKANKDQERKELHHQQNFIEAFLKIMAENQKLLDENIQSRRIKADENFPNFKNRKKKDQESFEIIYSLESGFKEINRALRTASEPKFKSKKILAEIERMHGDKIFKNQEEIRNNLSIMSDNLSLNEIHSMCDYIYEGECYNNIARGSNRVTIYRGQGITSNGIQEIQRLIKKTISPNGMFSCSDNLDVALAFANKTKRNHHESPLLITISSLTGTSICSSLGPGGEGEILLTPNSTLTVMSFKETDNIYRLELEEVINKKAKGVLMPY